MSELDNIFYSPKIYMHKARLTDYVKQVKRDDYEWNTLKGIIPITMEMDITNICSHRCPLCAGHRLPNSKGEQLYSVAGSGEQIPTTRGIDYIRQMASAGVKSLIFTGGGEPTVHAGLETLIVEAKKQGLDIGLITHGGLLHKKDMESLVENCTWIRVSIDAATSEEYQKCHGVNEREWKIVWNNLKELSVISRSSKNEGATIGAAFLTNKENSYEFLQFASLAKEAHVHYVQARPYHSSVAFNPMPVILEAKRKLDTDDFKVLASTQKYNLIRDDGTVEDRTYSYCHISQFASVICANEKVYVCCHHRNLDGFCIGDMRKDSFREIMKRQYRASINSSINVKKCISLCRGDYVNRLVQETLQEENETEINFPQNTMAHVNFL